MSKKQKYFVLKNDDGEKHNFFEYAHGLKSWINAGWIVVFAKGEIASGSMYVLLELETNDNEANLECPRCKSRGILDE